MKLLKSLLLLAFLAAPASAAKISIPSVSGGVSSGGGASTLAVQKDDVNVSSPTAVIDFDGDYYTVTESPTGETNVTPKDEGIDQAKLLGGSAFIANYPIVANGGSDPKSFYTSLILEAMIGNQQIIVDHLQTFDGVSPTSATDEWLSIEASSITSKFRGLPKITTFYFEQSRESPRFVENATNNAFVVTSSTMPDYGLMSFAAGVSSESNCGYFPMPSVRDYNSGVDFRLDEFRILLGTATDSGAQRYVVAVASNVAGSSWRTATYTQPINVDMASGLGTAASTERALATTPTLTNWTSIITSGVPWAVKVCRDGDDGTNDTSAIDSRFSMLTIRAANTVP